MIGDAPSLREIVAAFARALDRDVRYEEISDDEWKAEALARGWNAHAVEHLSSLWRALRGAALAPEAGRFAVTGTIAAIGGAPPKPFAEFVREHRDELARAAA